MDSLNIPAKHHVLGSGIGLSNHSRVYIKNACMCYLNETLSISGTINRDIFNWYEADGTYNLIISLDDFNKLGLAAAEKTAFYSYVDGLFDMLEDIRISGN
jgi:hypothetical protein